MQKLELVKRYVIFIVGLFVNSIGVALITKADLGTSPISSIPYVLSLSFTPTIGQFTIVFSLLLIVIQICLERRNYKPIQLLQIPVSVAFGYFIDFSMDYLLFWLDPQNYVQSIIYLLIGCVVLGFGVYMEVCANVVMLPGEGTVKSITRTVGTNFGTTKVSMDVTMAVCALVISLILSHQVQGVREGTIIAALLVGYISRFFGHLFKPIERRILAEAY
ncbi:putative membrane protein YczE [Catenibacillus scindens]|uniref:Putative membrane protein YczE n=1 Tax=Catenibacillus scindens TaxID=673271 RepID=A0A7W8M5H9_9FIRM|nr:DUF6198 family protein [Catenibacillus scindens]MBB5264939.1 putative membrane protein YczE [Catenibacillus scindens]